MKPKGIQPNRDAICRCSILPECMDKEKNGYTQTLNNLTLNGNCP